MTTNPPSPISQPPGGRPRWTTGRLASIALAAATLALTGCGAALEDPDDDDVVIPEGPQTGADPANQPPWVTLDCPPGPVSVGDAVDVTWRADDDGEGVVAEEVALDGPATGPVGATEDSAVTVNADAPGLVTITITATDDLGLAGTATCRLMVLGEEAPVDDEEDDPEPIDPAAPPTVSVIVDNDEDGGELFPGTLLSITVSAEAGDAELALIELLAESPGGPAAVAPGTTQPTSGTQGAVAFIVEVPAEGPLTLVARAIDTSDVASVVEELSIDVAEAPAFSADVSVVDLTYFGGGLPTSLAGRERAETVWSDAAAAEPVAEGTAYEPILDVAVDAVSALPGLPPDVEVSGVPAVLYRATLTPPAGADAAVVTVSAPGVAVVALDDAPVASADSEYATDAFGFGRLAPTSEPITIDGPTAFTLLVASDTGDFSWSATVSFLEAGEPALGEGTWAAP